LFSKLYLCHPSHFARLRTGFIKQGSTDVEGFLKFSLGVQNARKSRMGLSLEHHAQEIFRANGIKYSRGQITEHKNKPDFLFPDITSYRDPNFLVGNLTMLASKSTCKDRWRQVLSEASRIHSKHLLTLEPGISQNQTDEMDAKGLQLVVPRKIHSSYNPSQRAWLMDMEGFLTVVRDRQIRS
jgi:EcoRII C terminal